MALSPPLLPVAWMIRTHASPTMLRNAIQNELRVASGGLPVDASAGWSRSQSNLQRTRMNRLLFLFFDAAAWLLASVGIYGLKAYLVEQRRREIGTRLAPGASPGVVPRMVVFETARLATGGVAIGTPSAAGLTRVLASLLYGLKRGVPVSFLAVPLVLGSAALVADWIPAVRASRVDPSAALRAQ